jgi:ATP-binding cassette subfamily F protein 3
LKILLGEEEPTSGIVRRGHLVHLGYLDQHLKLLDEDKSVVRAIWPEPDESLTEQKMRDLLGSFGLHGELVEQPVRQLSGGERSRAALARLTVAGANVLVLDEPTNHLDIWASDALEEAVKAFDGTVVVVSHDRYFLNRVVDVLIVLETGRSEVVYGNYDTYELLRAARAESEKAKPDRNDDRVAATRSGAPARPAKERRKRKYPYRKAADVEAEIHAVEARVAELEAALQDVGIYKDPTRLKQTMAELEEAKSSLPGLYEHWEEAAELNG